ncbi:MAG TPA: O-antigen ligase family protein [Terriglobales bacterium]|nr:O-antigen ligase family protein [Terriglobales bacterium]
MSSAGQIPARISAREAAQWTVVTAFRPLHALMASPSLLFLATLGVMLFRPPDLQLYWLDRAAFLLLVFVVLLRALVLRQPLKVVGPVTWPMFGLLLLSLSCVLAQPYEPQNWSLFAARWVVPFTLYHLSGLVFDDVASLRKFEDFALIVLGYLSFIAILFLFDAKQLIFPHYILDESLGIHADRARGPFLQAVANGMTLNLLGLIALDSFRRHRLRGALGLLFLVALPLAVLATETRAVWLSFAAAVLVLLFFSSSRRVRGACLCLVLTGGLALLAVLNLREGNDSLIARLGERSPVEFRLAVYRAGWEMFLDKPLSGWGADKMRLELPRHISDFHGEEFYFHNTYLEIVVEHGLVGLALYSWVVIDLFR